MFKRPPKSTFSAKTYNIEEILRENRCFCTEGLAAARSPHGSGTISSIHYRSAALLRSNLRRACAKTAIIAKIQIWAEEFLGKIRFLLAEAVETYCEPARKSGFAQKLIDKIDISPRSRPCKLRSASVANRPQAPAFP